MRRCCGRRALACWRCVTPVYPPGAMVPGGLPVLVSLPALAATVNRCSIRVCSFDNVRRCCRISVVAGLFLTEPCEVVITAPSWSMLR